MKPYDPPFRPGHPEIRMRPETNGSAWGYSIELYPINWVRTAEDAQAYRTKVANAIADDVHGVELADLRSRIEKAIAAIDVAVDDAQLRWDTGAMQESGVDGLEAIRAALKGPA